MNDFDRETSRLRGRASDRLNCLLRASGAGALTTALVVGAAQAQSLPTTPPDAASQLGEVVVTAQRRAENAQTTPVSVSAFSQTALANRRIDTVTDLKQNVPNLLVEYNNINPSGILAYLRGAGNNGGFINAEQAVGVYIDDIYYARPTGLNLDFPDLGSLEVLRGPQGTLYGRNTLTGAIKFNRLQPNGSTFGSLEGSYGSYNETRLKGSYSAALTPDLAFLIAANGEHNDGFITDLAHGGGKKGGNDQYAVRGALALTKDGPFKATASIEYTNDRNDGVYFQAFSPTTLKPLVPYHTYESSVAPYARDTEVVADLHMSYDFGPVTVKSISGFISGTDASRFDLVGGRQLVSGAYSFGYDLAQASTETQFSEELQATGKALDGKFDYIAGLYYFYEAPKQTINVATNFGTQAVPVPTVYLPQTFTLTTNSYAAFVQGTYHFTDRLSATAGVRYTVDNKSVAETLQKSAAIAQLTTAAASTSFSNVAPKVGLDYKVTPDIFAYVSVSKGFQAGGFNASALASPAVVVRPYAPETLLAYEAGFKTEFFDHRVRFNIDGYVNQFTGLQLAAVDYVTGALTTQNAGSATVAGPEFELNYTPIHGLVVFAQGALTYGHYTSLNPTSSVATNHAEEIPYVSRVQGQMGFDDKIPLDSFGVHGDKGSAIFGYDISYRSTYTVAAANVPISQMPDVSLSDAYVGWQGSDGRLKVTVSGKNLFNRIYYFSGSTSGGLGYRNPGAPQEFRFTVRYGF
jgi:iron complex outermembrane receptor protein